MIIFAILPGLEERVITVVTPTEVASLAATILVDMPPVPRAEPALDTMLIILTSFTSRLKGGEGYIPSACKAPISSTTSMAWASG